MKLFRNARLDLKMSHSDENYPPANADVPAIQIYGRSEVTKHGMLKKKSGGKKVPILQKKYEPRYVIIHKGWVYYYKEKTSEKPQGKFSLQGFSNRVIEAEEEQGTIAWVFKLYHKKANERTWYFAAENEEEMHQWIDSFHLEIERYTHKETNLRTSRSMPNPLPSHSTGLAVPDANNGRSMSVNQANRLSHPAFPSSASSTTDVTSGFVSSDDMYEEVDVDSGSNTRSELSFQQIPLPPKPGPKPNSPKTRTAPYSKPLPALPQPAMPRLCHPTEQEENFPTEPPPLPPTAKPQRFLPNPPSSPQRKAWENSSPRVRTVDQDHTWGHQGASTHPAESPVRTEQYYADNYDNPGDNVLEQEPQGVYDEVGDDSYEAPCTGTEITEVLYDDGDLVNNEVEQRNKPLVLSAALKPTAKPFPHKKPPDGSKPTHLNMNKQILREKIEATAEIRQSESVPAWKSNLKSPTSTYPMQSSSNAVTKSETPFFGANLRKVDQPSQAQAKGEAVGFPQQLKATFGNQDKGSNKPGLSSSKVLPVPPGSAMKPPPPRVALNPGHSMGGSKPNPLIPPKPMPKPEIHNARKPYISSNKPSLPETKPKLGIPALSEPSDEPGPNLSVAQLRNKFSRAGFS